MIDLDAPAAPLARFAHDLRGEVRAAPFDLARYSDAEREHARQAWAVRIVDEYRSVAVFSELLHLLADLEAPFAALCAVQTLVGDELRHTGWCAEAAGWLGGHADFEIDLADIGLPPRGDTSKARRAFDISGRELVVGEEESIVVLAAYRDAATEPAFRGVLAGLLRDEVRHAATGRALFRLFTDGALAPHVSRRDRDELAAVMSDDRTDLRARYGATARGGLGRALGASLEPRDLAV
jgi:hypothetical protein